MTSTITEPIRGEIWYARFDPVMGNEQGGERPCLIVSDNRFNQSRANLVIVVPITRTERGIASHVRIEPPEGGLKSTSFAMCEGVRSIAKQRLQTRWGVVAAKTVASVEDRLRILMSF